MKEQLISLETAKLAKEKGFNEECSHYYDLDDSNKLKHTIEGFKYNEDCMVNIELEFHNHDNFNRHAAPTQSLLQKWLREEHNIHIQLHYDCKYKYWEFRNFILNKYIDKEHNKVYFECIGYNTYEEALEAGLSKALSII